MLSKIFRRARLEAKALTRRPFATLLNPFNGPERPSILHCCYHKVGTVWFARVLREVAAEFGMSFGTGNDYSSISRFETRQDHGVFVDIGSHVKLGLLKSYVGSHMIRDPRDVVVSGYFYHLWTEEPWANLPMAEYRGMSYREYLNSLDEEQGIHAEIRRVSFWVSHMQAWDFSNPRMFEIRYEDIRKDEDLVFRRMFSHYGFSDRAVERCSQIAQKYTFARLAEGTGSHLRSGRIGEWHERFSQAHKEAFKACYPGAVVKLGYETDDNW